MKFNVIVNENKIIEVDFNFLLIISPSLSNRGPLFCAHKIFLSSPKRADRLWNWPKLDQALYSSSSGTQFCNSKSAS